MKVRARDNKTPNKGDNKSKKTISKDKTNKGTMNPKITMKMRTMEKLKVAMMVRLMRNE